MKKNDKILLNIEDLGVSGEGVGKKDGFPIFIDYALPGEVIETKILNLKKNYGFGKIINIKKESVKRVTPKCPYYFRCGGCQIMHSSYDYQLQYKKHRVKDSLERIGGLRDVKVTETAAMEDPYFYRNKVQIPLGRENGKAIGGFYRKRSNDIIDMDECIIQNSKSNIVLNIVKKWIDDNNISTYQVDNKVEPRNLLRHLVVREGFNTGDLMVILVATSKNIPYLEELIASLKEIDGFKSFLINVNKEKTNVVLGKKNILVFGKDFIEDTIKDILFKISPNSFFQVNPVQTEIMYKKALEYADLKGDEIVFDAYSGAGTISLFLAEKAKKVYAIEIVEEAVVDAKENARINKIKNVEFIHGKAEEEAYKLVEKGIKPDVFVVDPPRKGCDLKLLETIRDVNPEKIVYVSCNPSTLARDLKILNDFGFKLKEATPVDNFPQTYHTEVVTLIERENF